MRTVCVLSVRNADLPSAQDSLGHTIEFLLERQLLGSPKLAMLERKRLDLVNKEKTLPTEAKHKELLASLVVIDVEISRGEGGKGIRATAYLTDNQGKQLGKVQVEEAEPQAASLAQKLQTALWKYWQADPPAKAANPGRESARFHMEGKRLYSQKDFPSATHALDAAFALAPSQPQVQVDLTRCLGDRGYFILVPNTRLELDKNGKLQVPADKLKDALHAWLRFVDLRRQAAEKLPRKSFASLQQHSVQYRFLLNVNLGSTLKLVAPESFDQEAAQLRDQFLEQYLRMHRVELDLFGEVAQQESSTTPSPFQTFTFSLAHSSWDLQSIMPPKWNSQPHQWPPPPEC